MTDRVYSLTDRHCVNLDTRYLRWVHWLPGKGGQHCGKYADWCGKSPAFVGMQQARTAMGMPSFFIRKVHPQSEQLLDYMDARLGNSSASVPLPTRRGEAMTRASSQEDAYAARLATDGNDYTRCVCVPHKHKVCMRVWSRLVCTGACSYAPVHIETRQYVRVHARMYGCMLRAV